MIDVEAIQDRVRDTRLFTTVSDMLSAASEMVALSVQPPSAFVSLSNETGKRNDLTGVHDTIISSRFSVLFVLRAQRAGGRRADEARTMREKLIMALSGWTPPGARKAMDYAGWSVIGVQNGLVWVEMRFDTEWRYRLVPKPPEAA
jgi:hypothetical protein